MNPYTLITTLIKSPSDNYLKTNFWFTHATGIGNLTVIPASRVICTLPSIQVNMLGFCRNIRILNVKIT